MKYFLQTRRNRSVYQRLWSQINLHPHHVFVLFLNFIQLWVQQGDIKQLKDVYGEYAEISFEPACNFLQVIHQLKYFAILHDLCLRTKLLPLRSSYARVKSSCRLKSNHLSLPLESRRHSLCSSLTFHQKHPQSHIDLWAADWWPAPTVKIDPLLWLSDWFNMDFQDTCRVSRTIPHFFHIHMRRNFWLFPIFLVRTQPQVGCCLVSSPRKPEVCG